MRAAPRLTVVLATVVLVVVAAVGAAVLAGPAQAAPGSIVWKQTVNLTTGSDQLDLCARGPNGSLYAAGTAGSFSARGDIWVTRYAASPVVYLMLGHDGEAYGNPQYRELVARSIRFVTQK